MKGLVAAHFVWAHWRWRWLRGAALARFQAARARAIVQYTAARSSFYRAHWRGYDLEAWACLPTVDKQLMMANFDGFTTRGVRGEVALAVALQAEARRDFRPTVDGLTVGLSSGTSGHRGLFVLSRGEQAAWAGSILARTLHWGTAGGRQRVAFFLRSNSNLYEQTGGWFIQFRYFDVMMPLSEAVAALNHFGPDVVVGPPSLLGLLAEARQQGTLQAAPKRLISVAEVLEPQDRVALETTFGVPVHQIYQCTEGLIAVSCAAGSLHIQEDSVVVQLERLADESPPGDGVADALGTRYTPIVTDLWRRVQPIVRYRLNDVLRLGQGQCGCGSSFRVIQSIEGRCDDLCYFEQVVGGVRPFFPDTIRRMILLGSGAIREYQVFQERCGQLRIHLEVVPGVAFGGVAAAVRVSVDQVVAQYGCRQAEVVIEPGLVPVAHGAKRRRVQRLG